MINWDIVTAQAQLKATEYANRKVTSHKNQEWDLAYNGYFQGFMENAAERESLRTINEKLRNTKPVGVETPISTSTFNDLDGLI